MREINLTPLDPAQYRDLVRRALDEDIGPGDLTTDALVEPSASARGIFLAKAECVVAGLDVAFEVFRQLDPSIRIIGRKGEGEPCGRGDHIAAVAGSAHALITGERTALNFLQRLSGIATLARKFVDAAGGRITVLDTRKTTPTLRVLEKYAVRAGGAVNHRTGLFDAVLIKDNHVRLCGGISTAVGRARTRVGKPVEVEVQNLEQLDEALTAGAEMVLIDNLSTPEIRAAVARVAGSAVIEISGGVTLERIPELAATGAGFVSIGALTHSAPAIDISFEIEPVQSAG